MVILRKIVVILATIVFFSGIALNWHIHFSYSENMPKSPDPASGRTHLVLVNHGVRVYVTEAEMQRKEEAESFLSDIGGLCFLVAAVLQGLYKTF